MASILKIGDRWRAQVRRRGQSIAKTFWTKGAAEAWAREIEGGIDKGQAAIDEQTLTVGESVRLYRNARNDFGRPVAEKSNEDYMLKRLESHFDDEAAAKLSTARLVKFAQAQERGGGAVQDRHGHIQARDGVQTHGFATGAAVAACPEHRAAGPRSPAVHRAATGGRRVKRS